MKSFTEQSDSAILHLIECSKRMIASIPSQKIRNRNYERRFSVFSDDNDEFKIFITQSIPNPIDFSIGLLFDEYLLFRCNGFHGPTKSGSYQYEHHAIAHTHTLTAEDILNGRERKPTKIENVTGQYIDVESALRYFLRRCGIINFEDFLPQAMQLSIEGE